MHVYDFFETRIYNKKEDMFSRLVHALLQRLLAIVTLACLNFQRLFKLRESNPVSCYTMHNKNVVKRTKYLLSSNFWRENLKPVYK